MTIQELLKLATNTTLEVDMFSTYANQHKLPINSLYRETVVSFNIGDGLTATWTTDVPQDSKTLKSKPYNPETPIYFKWRYNANIGSHQSTYKVERKCLEIIKEYLRSNSVESEYIHKSRPILHATSDMTGIELLTLDIQQGLGDLSKLRPLIDNGWNLSEKYLSNYQKEDEKICFTAQKGTDVLDIEFYSNGGTKIDYRPNQPTLEEQKLKATELNKVSALKPYDIIDNIKTNNTASLTNYKDLTQENINSILSSKELDQQQKIVAFSILKVENPTQLLCNHKNVNAAFSKYEKQLKANIDKYIVENPISTKSSKKDNNQTLKR